jgi:hypothetical protein
LKELLEFPSLHYEAIGDTSSLRESISRATKPSEAVVRVNINIYGPKDSGKDVGGLLTTHKVYLQSPDVRRPGSRYENPHILTFKDMDISSVHQLNQEHNGLYISKDAEELHETVSHLYASLKRGKDLKQVEGDRLLKTNLLL